MRFVHLAAGLAAALTAAAGGGDGGWPAAAGGASNAAPRDYAPPMLANGSLCLQIDAFGGQAQQKRAGMIPGILWAGRRYGPPNDQLIPFGHFEWETTVGGAPCAAPVRWSQSLDTDAAVATSRNELPDGAVLETRAFVPYGRDLVVLQRRLTPPPSGARPVRMTLRYRFTPPGDGNRAPRRMTLAGAWNESARSVEYRFQADAHRPCEGIVAVFCDRPASAAVDGPDAALSCDLAPEDGRPAEATFFLLFADSLDGQDFAARAAALRESARAEGFDGLLAAHRKDWAAYNDESYVRIPDARLQQVYRTAQYHLRANATRWSFPVGLFNTHWAGRFFGWDEMFCHQALISSNHRDLARRCPDFRFAGLPKALQRASHYGKPGTYGARFPWETLEDGSESAPPGFWMEHVFHMSNIAQSSWLQFLYTADTNHLASTGYPVIRECARFFLANMVYESADGRMFIGKCTDLERLGPARENPFMTACGAILTLEAAAQAAGMLGTNGTEAVAWRRTAGKLRDSLPRDGDRYVPYAGCGEESVASLGGLFPYPLFDASNALQRNAAYRFVEKGQASGNMYPVGQSLCAWYAGWLAAALALLGDRDEPARLLAKAAEGAGCFGELFEINEAEVSMKPWFATASGNVVFALNQMLVQSRGDEIRVAAGAPPAWKDYAFKLACQGDVMIEAAVGHGRLARLTLRPGATHAQQRRTLVLPAELVDESTLNRAAVTEFAIEKGRCRMAIRLDGPTEVVQGRTP